MAQASQLSKDDLLRPDRLLQLVIGPATQRSLPDKYQFRTFPNARQARRLDEKPILPDKARVNRWPPLLDTLAAFGPDDEKTVVAVTLGLSGNKVQLWVSTNGGQPSEKILTFYSRLWRLLGHWREAARDLQVGEESSPTPVGDLKLYGSLQNATLWLVVTHGWAKWKREMKSRIGDFNLFYSKFKELYPASDASIVGEGFGVPSKEANVNEGFDDSESGDIDKGSYDEKEMEQKKSAKGMEEDLQLDSQMAAAQEERLGAKEKKVLLEAVDAMHVLHREIAMVARFFDNDANKNVPKSTAAGLAPGLSDSMKIIHDLVKKFFDPNKEYHSTYLRWLRRLKVKLALRSAIERCARKKSNLSQHMTILIQLVRSRDTHAFFTSSGDKTEFNVDPISEAGLDMFKPTEDNVRASLNAIQANGNETKMQEVISSALTNPPRAVPLHAELAQVAFYLKRVRSQMRDGKPAPLPYIGVSKLLCYSCCHFIEVFNEVVKDVIGLPNGFGFRGSNHKAYRAWTMPKALPEDIKTTIWADLTERFLSDYKRSGVGHFVHESDSSTQSGDSVFDHPGSDSLDWVGGWDEAFPDD